jgi:hypothetical protein
MKMRIANKAGLVILVLLALAVTAFAGDTLLRMKYNKGDQFTYKLTSKSNSEQMGMKISSEEIKYMQYKVLGVEDGEATIEVKITRVIHNSENPMSGKVSFDSDKKDAQANPGMAQYMHLINKPFKIKMDTRGRVKAVIGYADIGKKMIEKMTADAGSDPRMQAQLKRMAEMFTDEAMINQMNMSNTQLPEGEVADGAQWNDEGTMPTQMGELLTKMKHTLEGVENDIARIKLTGTIELKEASEEEATKNPMAGMMKITDGKMEGTVEFDTDLGCIKKRDVSISMAITFMNQESPSKQTETMELVEHKAAE